MQTDMMWQYVDECVLLRATNSRWTTSYYCCLAVARGLLSVSGLLPRPCL